MEYFSQFSFLFFSYFILVKILFSYCYQTANVDTPKLHTVNTHAQEHRDKGTF